MVSSCLLYTSVYTVVEQEQELNAVAKIFAELLGEEADIEMS